MARKRKKPFSSYSEELPPYPDLLLANDPESIRMMKRYITDPQYREERLKGHRDWERSFFYEDEVARLDTLIAHAQRVRARMEGKRLRLNPIENYPEPQQEGRLALVCVDGKRVQSGWRSRRMRPGVYDTWYPHGPYDLKR